MPTQNIAARLKNIRLLVLDVDGTLTDAGMYYAADGRELKKFNTHDGLGIRRLIARGIPVAFITGETSVIVKNRAKKLGVRDVFLGIDDKLPGLKRLLKKYKLALHQAAYVGDDLGDLECLQQVGLACAVKNAVPEIKAAAHYVTKLKGGEGAAREVCDLILKANKISQ